ncbi:hypothetical protein LSAT2_001319 [Lamellibrachia satsuma]|nr:hypothetical protein LSAT2_001319 [Lamellibrachia satsuma]
MKYTYWILLAVACAAVVDGVTKDMDSCLDACYKGFRTCMARLEKICPFTHLQDEKATCYYNSKIREPMLTYAFLEQLANTTSP